MPLSSIKPPQWFYLTIVILVLVIVVMMAFFDYKFHIKDGEFGFAKKDFFDSIVVDGQCFKPVNVHACHRIGSNYDHFITINGTATKCQNTANGLYASSGNQAIILAKVECK